MSGLHRVTPRQIHVLVVGAVATLAPFFFGSVDFFWVTVWTLVLAAAATYAVTIPFDKNQCLVVSVPILLMALYLAIAAMQFMPRQSLTVTDGMWQSVATTVGPQVIGRIAVRSRIDPVAVGHFLLFSLSILNGLFIGMSSRSSRSLIRVVALSTGAYAVYGLLSWKLFPEFMLWTHRTAYFENLTTTFVNRNTAASLMGTGTILFLAHAVAEFRRLNIPSLRAAILVRSGDRRLLNVLMNVGAAALCFVALVATGSRAALVCFVVGGVAMLIPLIAYRLRLSTLSAILMAVVAGSGLLAAVSGMGRMATLGLFDSERMTTYLSLLRAIQERPWLGSGAGTFAEVFPSLRQDQLALGSVWEMAHSTILEIAVESGIPFSLLVLVSAIAAVLFLIRSATTRRGGDRYIIAAVTGVTVFAFVHSFVDFSLQVPGYFVVFGLIFGVGIGRSASPSRRYPADRSAAAFGLSAQSARSSTA